MFDLFVKSTESDEVLLIVKVDGVLDVLPVLRVFSVCVPVVAHLGRSLETHFAFFLLQIKQNTHANTTVYSFEKLSSHQADVWAKFSTKTISRTKKKVFCCGCEFCNICTREYMFVCVHCAINSI